MTILGIETSHDDTSVALLKNGEVLKMFIFSQIDIHAKYGGTIPEIASREHVNNVALVLEEFKKEFNLNEIDFIAYTAEPGLLGALHIGYLFASAISLALDKPLKPINHLVGHIFSTAIEKEITYPALALIVSGGHTQINYLSSPIQISLIGETLDDAVGEVYDKVARKLDLGFPGGPAIDQLVQNSKSECKKLYSIPKTENKFSFSLSGIKTQVINEVNKFIQKNEIIPAEQIAVCFQKTIVEYLKQKIESALKDFPVKSLLLAGGVSANSDIRTMILSLHKNAIIPNLKYATDNGAMIAKAAEILEDFKN
ncbi:tRNA (adenosine(37)-N6)-threonylcarbamoyltransferase complex transferase subunit TsaD [Mycoplasma iguanae]|uniref:tRNA N6-adenosine threonylcarbamoyltransferase n=1 Tax=Mycoplasma iguanae TaxID=292461 RepID=A0ABY5R896_9MOLU|nr:tRNA (adenosine(37)-N6)-threonylcarbamoyltransferase complex transferase subunit TsaD [Mycoplasma iguanae]UVD81728.1 tRNA (adenosine(37)-N6)-threonylcarbamoyltransferase complex transferase subunit TsaD [Mycoplasma iguanae]